MSTTRVLGAVLFASVLSQPAVAWEVEREGTIVKLSHVGSAFAFNPQSRAEDAGAVISFELVCAVGEASSQYIASFDVKTSAVGAGDFPWSELVPSDGAYNLFISNKAGTFSSHPAYNDAAKLEALQANFPVHLQLGQPQESSGVLLFKSVVPGSVAQMIETDREFAQNFIIGEKVTLDGILSLISGAREFVNFDVRWPDNQVILLAATDATGSTAAANQFWEVCSAAGPVVRFQGQ